MNVLYVGGLCLFVHIFNFRPSEWESLLSFFFLYTSRVSKLVLSLLVLGSCCSLMSAVEHDRDQDGHSGNEGFDGIFTHLGHLLLPFT